MNETESAATWSAWFLDAIRKIRSQKQRPSVERICHAIRQHHNYHEEEIAEHLEVAVKRGDVLKIFNKGQSSYKDPGGLQSRPLKVTRSTDLSKVLGKAVRELGEREGSTLKNIERYIRQSHTVEEQTEGDLRNALRLSAKRAVDRGLVLQDGRLFRQSDRPPYLKKLNDAAHAPPEPPAPKVSHLKSLVSGAPTMTHSLGSAFCDLSELSMEINLITSLTRSRVYESIFFPYLGID